MVKSSFLILGSKAYKKSTVVSLIDEAEKLFDTVTFISAGKCRIMAGHNANHILYKDRSLKGFDAVYPRLSSKDFLFGQAILRVLNEYDTYNPVNLRSFQVANHKYYTIKVLANAGVPVIKSSLFISPETVKANIKEFGLPVVIKTLSGYAGKGVVLVEDAKQFESILDTVQLFEEVISAQKFIPKKNSDIRCYVIGEQVIGIKRTGRQGEWRANISRGGSAEEITLSPEMRTIALNAAKAFKMDICSIDLIETPSGPGVIEVNFMPGPFKKYLGNKITKAMVEYIYNRTVERKNTY